MYGFFIHAFEKFITAKYGKERWQLIRLEAGVFEDIFDDVMQYDDNMIIEIMDAACELLEVDVYDLQREFGESYFENCLHSKHGPLLKRLGGNLYDFLTSIDSLHDHLGVSYPGVKLPSFRVKEEVGGRISVNYYSDRDELEYMVPGIIKRAAKVLFDMDVQATPLPEVKTIIIINLNSDHVDRMFPPRMETSRDLIPHANEPKVSPLEFTKVFPFHMVFDRNMILKEVGATLRRIIPDINLTKNAKITSFFSLSRPQIYFTFDSIYSRLDNIFILSMNRNTTSVSFGTGNHHYNGSHHLIGRENTSARKPSLRLKGEMVYLEEKGVMLFLGSPLVTTIQDMRNKGLCLNDIPVHDATRDLVLLCDNVHKEMELAQQLNVVSDHLKKIHGELEEHLILYNRLLYAVLPPSIAQRLGEGKPVPTERFLNVTLMFSGIVDFVKICSDCEPKTVVHMLNDLYTKFDGLFRYLDGYAYKVETVGDKYMSASGVPDKVSNHSMTICNLALDMHDLVREVRFKGKRISVTFGIHSGEIVAGVIGHKMPRYCLFGNTVNLTSRTETTGIPGKINVTEDTYNLLDQSHEKFALFHFEERGPVKMKGKSEPMKTYLLRRKQDRNMMLNQHNLLNTSQDLDVKDGGPQGSNNEYISLYRNLRSGPSVGGRKSRPLSKFSTPGGSHPASIVNTPSLRSRCSSGIFGTGLTSSFYDLNNNSIYEDVEGPVTTPTFAGAVTHPWTSNEETTDAVDPVKTFDDTDSMIAPSVMSEFQVENVTKMLNEINETIQNED